MVGFYKNKNYDSILLPKIVDNKISKTICYSYFFIQSHEFKGETSTYILIKEGSMYNTQL